MLKNLAKLVALAALGWGCSAQALGLGEIEIKSRLNQPLSALIPISSATPKELESLSIELASNEDFERAGMERAEYLSSLKFEIKDNTIRVTSKDMAREPFVSFLLDVRWAGGRLLREYTVLLDPPNLAQQQKPAPRQVEEPAVEKPAVEAPIDEIAAPQPAAPAIPPIDEEPVTAPAPPPDQRQVQATASSSETYGPIQPKETLWSVAYKLRPDPSLTMDQMQVAIFNANRKAFEDGRLTGLMKGSVIRIPDIEEIRAVDPASAKSQVAQANRNSGRRPAPAMPVVAPPAPVAAEEIAPVSPTPTPTPTPTPAPSEAAPKEIKPEPAAAAPAEPAAAATTDQAAMVDPPSVPPASTDAPTEVPVQTAPMVDPAPSQPAPAESVQTEPLPEAAPVAQVPAEIEEPGLLEQILGLTEHPLFFPVAAGLVVLLVLLVMGGKLRDKYARWSYERASRKQVLPTAELMAGGRTQVNIRSPQAELEQANADQDAATVVRDQTLRAPRVDVGMAATATQVMVAETQQQTMQQTLQQTQVQTPEPAMAQTAGPKVDFDVSGTYATETVQINLDAGDPVSEAEFHRAYGLYDEAALLLKQALEKDPKRTDARVKLAEIYFEANKASEFVETAKKLKGQLPDSEWQKIALLGSQIAAGNDLFEGAGAGGEMDLSFDEPAAVAAAPSPAKSAPAPAPAPAAVDSGMLDFKLDDINLQDVAAPTPLAQSPPAESALEFDLGSLSLDTPASPASAPKTAASDTASIDSLSLGDFDLNLDAPAPAAPSAPAAQAASTDSLDLGGELTLDETPVAGDESSTKLDLARAYMDMGDNDMARSLLNEVQQQGSAQQKKEAQELLSRVAA